MARRRPKIEDADRSAAGFMLEATRPHNPPAGCLIVGLGRWHRADDQIGLRILDTLRAAPPVRATLMTATAPAADLLPVLEGVRLLVIADAAASNERFPPGSWIRVDYMGGAGGAHACPTLLRRLDHVGGGHTLGVADTLELAAQLHLLPPHVWIYAVAGSEFGYGDELSPLIETAIAEVARQIRTDVQGWVSQEAGRA